MTFTTDKEDRIKDNGQAGEVASFADLMSDNHFARLPEHFYTRQAPAAIQDPRMVAVNQSVLTLLGLAPELASSDELLQLSSGNWLAPNFAPLAMKYAGHQFGQYNPALGDGRGLLLAQVQAANHMHTWDLHLKGAGRTPYSRQGDGRAVLRSSIREFLCSAAMQEIGRASCRERVCLYV